MQVDKRSLYHFVFVTLALLGASFSARAALINPILGLDIGGTLYDVTFHDQSGDSFNALWDADDIGVFGSGSSVFGVAPTFWLNQTAALAARDAIILHLGDTDTTTTASDSFFIPIGTLTGGITAGVDRLNVAYDGISAPPDELPTAGFIVNDFESGGSSVSPYASFVVSRSAGVPLPFTPALLILGLMAVQVVKKRRVSWSN